MWIVRGLMVLCFVAGMSGVARADFTHDIRVKFGNAPGIDNFELKDANLDRGVNPESGRNFQVEYAMTIGQDTRSVGLVWSAGLFRREHSGNMTAPALPDTKIEYTAVGVSGSAGISIKTNDRLHFEGRVGLDFGAGKPTLSTSGPAWNDVEAGGYLAFSLIAGGYYVFNKPGVILGLELGTQSYAGGFKIWNSAGQYWSDATVTGFGPVANIILGVRF